MKEKKRSKTFNGVLTHPGYNPDPLLKQVMEILELKNYAALARALDVPHAVISKVRHRRVPVGARLVIRIHEAAGLTLPEIRRLSGTVGVKY
jgi:plasmid maintenance system antidote protein VapI